MRSLTDHLEHPALADPPTDGSAVEGCAGGSCGVVARFFLDVREGVICNCTARVRGRAAALATASALCEAAIGRTVTDAARLGLTTLHQTFAELSPEDHERAQVVEDGFHHAIGRYWLARMRAGDAPAAVDDAPDIAVAMSGGVDSAVALHDMHSAHGSNVLGVTLRLWIDPKAPDPEMACCAPDSVRRARTTCHALGVPHVSLDLRETFAREVVAPFIAQYKAGETPNPCVGCNGHFRLDELVAFADAIGAASVATGHYVRRATRAGRTLVQRGVDSSKDQSYMLSRLSPDVIARYLFPLGELRKPQVRERARELGLVQATVRESQEVCFLGGGDYRKFLGRMNALGTGGTIELEDGTVLGEHEGIAGFTPGQRRGLGVNRPRDASPGAAASTAEAPSTTAPLYVLSTSPATGVVTVGDRADLRSQRVELRDTVAWVPGIEHAWVQLRYRTRDATAPATIEWSPDGTSAIVHFESPVFAPAPGQTACLYDEQGVVLGVGTIARPTS